VRKKQLYVEDSFEKEKIVYTILSLLLLIVKDMIPARKSGFG